MSVAGIFASDAAVQGERQNDFTGTMLRINPTGSAPLLALTSGMRSSGAGDVLVTWFEENHVPGRQKLTANYNSSATSIVLDDASSYIAGTILLVEDTGEYLFVSAVSGNTLTVIRGFADTTADSLTLNKFVQRIGTAHEEGSARPRAVAHLGYPVINFMQIFRNAWNVTGTMTALNYLTGDRVAKNMQDAANDHAEDIERSIMFGKKTAGVKNGQPFRTMNGVLSMIETNVTGAGSTTSYNQLDAFFKDVFSRNIKGQPNERIAFCGNGAVSVLNQIAMIEGQMNIQAGQTEFGMNVHKWITPYGNVSLMTHPLMTESPLWTKDLYVLHPGAIETRYLRKTHVDNYDKDGSRAGADADFGVFTTEMSVMYKAEVTGGKYTGLTAGVANT